MIDVTKILTSMVSGGTQAGGAGGMLGQIASAALQNPQAAQAGLGGLLGSLGGAAQTQASGGLLGQIAGMAGQATQTAQAQAGGLLGQVTQMAQNAQAHGQAMQAQAQGGLGGLLAGLAGAATQAGQTAQNQAGGLLGTLTGALQGAQGQAGSAQQAMTGFLAQAGELLKANAGGFAGGAAAGTLAGLLLGTGAGRQIAGSAAKLGGLAAIGGLAYVALQNFQAGRPVVQGTIDDVTKLLGLGKAPDGMAEAGGDANQTATILLRAMVAAAFADGEMTADERAAIVGQLDAMGLNDEEKAYMDGLLATPMDAATIAAACTTDEMRAQAYLAAQLAIEVDSREEVAFLKSFARALGLDSQLVAHLDQAAAEAKAAKAA